MAILNYTTKIDAVKTVGEIQEILAKHGAQSVSIDFVDRLPVAVTFLINLNNDLIAFRLPSNHIGVYKTLCKDNKIENRYKTQEQARRVAWRIVKDWVEAQMAVIEAGLATLPEVFLPYAVVNASGQTVYESVSQSGMRFLTSSQPKA